MDVPFATLECTEMELRLLRTVLAKHSGQSIAGEHRPDACNHRMYGLGDVAVDRLGAVSYAIFECIGDVLKPSPKEAA
jgi:hypothetical protein